MAVRLLAFHWVEIEGVANVVAAEALGIAPYQCTRWRTWVRRELPRAYRLLFGDDAARYDW